MGLFQDIHDRAKERNLDFVVIGGIAVIFHGLMRDTADLDLLIRRQERGSWLDILLSGLSYKIYEERENFVQLDPPAQGAWPVDLMLVADKTFEKIFAVAAEEEMYGTRLKIPILDHLLALKLHALKHGHIGRHMKDRLDLEGLIRVNHLDIKSEKMRTLFLKYGNLNIYEQVS